MTEIKPFRLDSFRIDFDPTKYKTQSGAAKALYKALRNAALRHGQTPDKEVFLLSPQENEQHGTGDKSWRVVWEAGPYEWAIAAASCVHNMPHWYTEPHYSFDLCFTD